MQGTYRMGLDVGSTTAKVVVVDERGALAYSRYERHNARVNDLVRAYLDDIKQRLGNCKLRVCVTGSVGMATAEQLHATFVQEVVAATVYARHSHPETEALIDIGGEDAKVVFFNGKSTELRMNGNCAGGTGAFIDQMAVLMGCDNQHMSDLALRATTLYPMAARCGVFAKTDIQNLMARNLPEADIAASIFHSIAVQTVTTLSHGCTFKAPILLCGGPFTFLPALRKAFADYLKMRPDDFIVLSDGNLIPALGCAIQAEKGRTVTLDQLFHTFADNSQVPHRNTACSTNSHTNQDDNEQRLAPLFRDETEHTEWLFHKNSHTTPVHPLRRGVEQVVIGIDSGSTTTKIIAARANAGEEGQIVFADYSMNLGNPIKAAREGFGRLLAATRKVGTDLQVVGSCATGYGEELIQTAFGLDDSIIETMAHYRAAERLVPDVSFILDIGGQDMKAIFVDHGAVVRMELNEACSSGCGTFIQTFAKNLGYGVADFAQLACRAKEPCDLGTRCTVFMNSKVKQVLREGASVADIAAGLSYSVVRNCLYKVLKLRENDDLGGKIVVQGGTMKNDSVVRAFELLTHTQVARSNMPEMMGAYGCALHALHKRALDKGAQRAVRSVDSLLGLAAYDTRLLGCKGCENRCSVTMYDFGGGRRFYSGNKCERMFNNKGNKDIKGENIYEQKVIQPWKGVTLASEPAKPLANGQQRVGIPRVLNMYEDYPFWFTLFTEAGFQVMLSSESHFSRYEATLHTVMSDNICFPAKLAHAHIQELDVSDVSFIFMPYVVFERQDDERNTNSYNCPIVAAYSDVIRNAMSLKKRVDSPVINFSNLKLLHRQIRQYLKGLGVSDQTIQRAFFQAVEAQERHAANLRQRASNILRESRRKGKLTIMLVGRPYHADPLVQHKLSEMIASLGANVISDDIVRGDSTTGTGETYLVRQWAYMNRIIKAAQWCAEQPGDVQLVQMTSFGCGPDAFIQDELRAIMKNHGKPFTLLKIDDVSNIGSLKLRVRSLIESLRGQVVPKAQSAIEPFVERPMKGAAKRHILAPYFTEYLTPVLTSLCHTIGFDVEVLPMSDAKSAELGLKYANNEICYPATLIIGDIVKALRSGRYDPDKISVAMSQTGGQCRATNYAALIRRAMDANGFRQVPLITLGVSTSATEDQTQSDKMDIPWVSHASIIVTTFLYGDTLSKMYHASVSRLKPSYAMPVGKSANAAEALRDKYMQLANQPILDNNANALMELIAQAAKEFDEITADKDVPAVGIVGEIFLKFNPFAHQFLAKKIIERGFEVVPALLSPFFLQEFVNVIAQKHMALKCSHVPDFAVKVIYNLIWQREKRINKLASRFRYFRPFTNIFDDAKEVNGVVSLAAQFGEGWLLPSDIISMVKQGICNVASLQPFGCIANHIVSKGIEKRLKTDYPQLNLVSLDFDAGVSAVNVTNRLLLFLDSIA